MSTTKRSDLIVPEVLEEAIKGAFAGMNALYGSKAVIVNGSFPAGSKQGGESVKIPYFGTLGELDTISSEGDALIPAKITMTSETANVLHAGKAFEITQWAEIATSYADPYGECAKQVVEAVKRFADSQLITKAAATALVNDVYSATVPRTIDYDAIVDGKMLWGDEQDEIALMVIHSKVLGDLFKLKDNSGRPLVTDGVNGEMSRFANIPFIVSDKMTPAGSPSKYSTLLLKKNSLVFWYQNNPSVQVDKDILADTNVAAIHVYCAAHMYVRLPGSSKCGVVAVKHN